jgi:hypothetical protein
MLAAALGTFLLIESYLDGRAGNGWRIRPTRAAACILVVILGLALSACQMSPRSDTADSLKTYSLAPTPGHIANVAASYAQPVLIALTWWKERPDRTLEMKLRLAVNAAAGMALLACLCLAFARYRPLLSFYAVTTGSLLALSYIKHSGYPIHNGAHLFTLLSCFWIRPSFVPRPLEWPWLDRLARACDRRSGTVLWAVLLIQLAGAAVAIAFDVKQPFSGSRDAADFIRRQGLENAVIAGDSDYGTSPIAGYLNTRIYYLCSSSWGRFILWDNKRHDHAKSLTSHLSDQELAAAIGAFVSGQSGEVLLILTRPMPASAPGNVATRFLARFPGRVYADESYWLYLATTQ